MKSVQKIDLGLTGYDELFMNDAERKENKLPRIYDIPLSEIDDFPDHPFKVKLDEDMDQLVQSIKERGIITPVTLRPKEDGRYEIVSGHRRKKACELAGFDTVKAEVREMTRDEAIILMVESNLQRSVMNNSLAEVHPELVSEWSEKNLTLTPDDITFGSNKKVWWKGACGHEWQASVKARSNGEKCPICSGARVMAGINDLATLESLLVKQWSKKNKIKPTEVSIGSHKKVIWRCEKGHEWEAAVKSRTINKTGCPYCSHNKVLAGFNDLATLLPDIAAEWSDRNYPLLPTQVTVFANRKAWWKCKDCGREWNTLISTRSGGSKCPYCSGYIFLKGFNDLQTTHPEIASEWSEKNLPLKPDEVNAKSRKNVWWRCGKCGNEWKSVINARVKGTV